eukprot:m51a1_g9441 putative peroxisomal pex3 (299) ;mRNA; f:446708-447825
MVPSCGWGWTVGTACAAASLCAALFSGASSLTAALASAQRSREERARAVATFSRLLALVNAYSLVALVSRCVENEAAASRASATPEDVEPARQADALCSARVVERFVSTGFGAPESPSDRLAALCRACRDAVAETFAGMPPGAQVTLAQVVGALSHARARSTASALSRAVVAVLAMPSNAELDAGCELSHVAAPAVQRVRKALGSEGFAVALGSVQDALAGVVVERLRSVWGDAQALPVVRVVLGANAVVGELASKQACAAVVRRIQELPRVEELSYLIFCPTFPRLGQDAPQQQESP